MADRDRPLQLGAGEATPPPPTADAAAGPEPYVVEILRLLHLLVSFDLGLVAAAIRQLSQQPDELSQRLVFVLYELLPPGMPPAHANGHDDPSDVLDVVRQLHATPADDLWDTQWWLRTTAGPDHGFFDSILTEVWYTQSDTSSEPWDPQDVPRSDT